MIFPQGKKKKRDIILRFPEYFLENKWSLCATNTTTNVILFSFVASTATHLRLVWSNSFHLTLNFSIAEDKMLKFDSAVSIKTSWKAINPSSIPAVMGKKGGYWKLHWTLDGRNSCLFEGFKSELCFWHPLIHCHHNLTSAERSTPFTT